MPPAHRVVVSATPPVSVFRVAVPERLLGRQAAPAAPAGAAAL